MHDRVYDDLIDLVGNTPIVRLSRVSESGSATILGKVEYFNPAGSVKDRIGMAMVEAAEREGLLRPGMTIVEPTSGNTGVALAVVAAVKGYRPVLTMPERRRAGGPRRLEAGGGEGGRAPASGGMAGAAGA